MSTPPFIAMPDGVALFEPPDAPLPVLVAEADTRVTGGADGVGGWSGTAPREEGASAAASAQAPAGASAASASATASASPWASAAPAAPRGNVLLVPGFTGSKEDYIAIIAPLAALGWRVAAMDLPGQGGAAGLGPRGSHTVPTLAAAVLGLADWFSPAQPVHLVGHSMGGLVTREALLQRPDRLASWTPVCSGVGRIPESAHASLVGLQAALGAVPIEQIWIQKEAQDRAGGWDPPSQEVADFCAGRFIANDPAGLADFAEILMTAPDRTDEAAAVLATGRIGGAVVTGALDDAWPIEEQRDMATRLGVPWEVVPGVGHNPATEDPAATVAVLDAIFAAAARG
jgi:pimeloyl-ACP methyl ester carboxylesterase